MGCTLRPRYAYPDHRRHLARGQHLQLVAGLGMALAAGGISIGSGLPVHRHLYAVDLAAHPSYHRWAQRRGIPILCPHRPVGGMGSAVGHRAAGGGLLAAGSGCQGSLKPAAKGWAHRVWPGWSWADRNDGYPFGGNLLAGAVAGQSTGPNRCHSHRPLDGLLERDSASSIVQAGRRVKGLAYGCSP
jgi:hypothetical protein